MPAKAGPSPIVMPTQAGIHAFAAASTA